MAAFVVDGTPVKRIFRSIIADYSFLTSLCELIDNSIDHWIAALKSKELLVQVFLNVDRRMVTVRDNAGGVRRGDFELLIRPGASRDDDSEQFIGNFGVGGKRAGIALGQHVKVSSRTIGENTFMFHLTDDWLEKDTWDVEVEESGSLDPGCTEIAISSLRQGFNETDVENIKRELSAIYAKFISSGLTLQVNGANVNRLIFDNWAYPPEYLPQSSTFSFAPNDKDQVRTKISAGLIIDRDPKEENYGVYVYCNDRLIVAHEKSHQVGFHRGAAGVPHPDASLSRTIVEFHGRAELMPWTSSKSGINWSHPTFMEVRDRVIALTTYFSTLSRRLKDNREEGVFRHEYGSVQSVDLSEKGTEKRVIELPLPRGRKKNYPDKLLEENTKILARKPWTLGLVEAMGVVDSLSRKRLQTKNRMALVLLDSNLEIGLKEFIVHEKDIFRPDKYNDEKLLDIFRRRHLVINEVKPHISVSDDDWAKVGHYYEKRNKLVHERATVEILDSELEDYTRVVKRILTKLFGVSL